VKQKKLVPAKATHRIPQKRSAPGKTAAKDASDTPLAGIVLTTMQAANLVLLSRVRLSELVRDGWIKQPTPNRLDPAEVVRGYIGFLRDEERRGTKSAGLTRVQEARAVEIEQRTARESGSTIGMDEACAIIDSVIGGLAAELRGLPARYTRDMAERTKLETELDDILTRTADLFEQEARASAEGGEVDPAEAEAST
jgi:hypothetical protein